MEMAKSGGIAPAALVFIFSFAYNSDDLFRHSVRMGRPAVRIRV